MAMAHRFGNFDPTLALVIRTGFNFFSAGVQLKGQINDGTAGCPSPHDGHVSFCRPSLLKLPTQVGGRRGTQRHHQNAAGACVQTVHRVHSLFELIPQPIQNNPVPGNAEVTAFRRMNVESGWFMNGDPAVTLAQNAHGADLVLIRISAQVLSRGAEIISARVCRPLQGEGAEVS